MCVQRSIDEFQNFAVWSARFINFGRNLDHRHAGNSVRSIASLSIELFSDSLLKITCWLFFQWRPQDAHSNLQGVDK